MRTSLRPMGGDGVSLAISAVGVLQEDDGRRGVDALTRRIITSASPRYGPFRIPTIVILPAAVHLPVLARYR